MGSTMFRLSAAAHLPLLRLQVDGRDVAVPEGASVAAVALLAGVVATRVSPVDGSPRAPFCMMGVCFECLMTVDGEPEVQTCLVAAREGMVVACGGAAGAGA